MGSLINPFASPLTKDTESWESEFKNYYICGVGINPISSSNPGTPYLDVFFDLSEEDIRQLYVEKVLKSVDLANDKKNKLETYPTINKVVSFLVLANIRESAQNLIFVIYKTDLELCRQDLDQYIQSIPFVELKKHQIQLTDLLNR